MVLNKCLNYELLPISHMYMNHLLFTFKNINVRVRILDNKKKHKKQKKKKKKNNNNNKKQKKKKKKKKKQTEKLKRYTFKMICIFATDSI